MSMVLKPQDVLVLLKLVAVGQDTWSYNRLALELGMSPSEVHSAIKRALAAGLAVKKHTGIQPLIRNLVEFLLHGLRFVFIPEHRQLTRGMPTAHAAPPLKMIIVSDQEPPPVWPDPNGEISGMAFSPLYKSAPKAARQDQALYELLALLDAIRGGRAREREIAAKELRNRLEQYDKSTESQS